MKKEKTIRTYQRRTKTGKVVTVKQHTAKYDAAEAMKEAAKKKGAGDELEILKNKPQAKPAKEVAPKDDATGFTAEEFKAWYHWDQDADPRNAAAKKVEKALKAKMGAKGYKKYFDEMTDSYSSRGHNKAFKGLGEKFSTGEDKKASTSAGTKLVTPAKETKSVKGPKESTTLVAHVDGDNSIKYKVTPTSPMVKDVAFTKYIADDTYSETFPKGGSYEFFYAKRNKGGDVGLYAKRGNDIFELEETEPSKSLAKKLGSKSSKSSKVAEANGGSEKPRTKSVMTPHGRTTMIARKEIGTVGRTKYYQDSVGNVYKRNNRVGVSGDGMYSKLSSVKAKDVLGQLKSSDVDKAREVIAKHEKQQAAEKHKAGKQKIAQLKEKGYALVRTGATGSYYAKKGSRTVYNPDGTKAMPSQAEYALTKLAGRKPRRLK